MDRPTVSSHDGGSAAAADTGMIPHYKDTAPLSEDSLCVSGRLRTKRRHHLNPKQRREGNKNFKDIRRKVFLTRGITLSFDSPRTRWRTRVFLMSSLSLRLLERCKVCLFKTTPFSLCQKKITAVHKATFYFYVAFLCFWKFLFHMNYEQVLMFLFLH